MAKTKLVLPYDKSEFTIDDQAFLNAIRRDGTNILKIGLESIFAGFGNRSLRQSVGEHVMAFFSEGGGANILIDAKLHDIPNTVAGAIRNLAGRVGGITLHASNGPKGLKKAALARSEILGSRSGVAPDDPLPWTVLFGVTVLTSFDVINTACVYNTTDIEKQVLQFARMLLDNGIDGIVCSPRELRALRDKGLADKFVTLVPGIRPEWFKSEGDDQARTATPSEAAKLGADYIVVGRPIWKGPYIPVHAVQRIKEELLAA